MDELVSRRLPTALGAGPSLPELDYSDSTLGCYYIRQKFKETAEKFKFGHILVVCSHDMVIVLNSSELIEVYNQDIPVLPLSYCAMDGIKEAVRRQIEEKGLNLGKLYARSCCAPYITGPVAWLNLQDLKSDDSFCRTFCQWFMVAGLTSPQPYSEESVARLQKLKPPEIMDIISGNIRQLYLSNEENTTITCIWLVECLQRWVAHGLATPLEEALSSTPLQNWMAYARLLGLVPGRSNVEDRCRAFQECDVLDGLEVKEMKRSLRQNLPIEGPFNLKLPYLMKNHLRFEVLLDFSRFLQQSSDKLAIFEGSFENNHEKDYTTILFFPWLRQSAHSDAASSANQWLRLNGGDLIESAKRLFKKHQKPAVLVLLLLFLHSAQIEAPSEVGMDKVQTWLSRSDLDQVNGQADSEKTIQRQNPHYLKEFDGFLHSGADDRRCLLAVILTSNLTCSRGGDRNIYTSHWLLDLLPGRPVDGVDDLTRIYWEKRLYFNHEEAFSEVVHGGGSNPGSGRIGGGRIFGAMAPDRA
ncbi:hypothetical protein S7711_11420 [Stachybotrys chartarum IBT 7711]|uniref:Uncharacterized protein n=1 Tax=Stachybotrys chartarum (strain CBS 109288 / IBT 7711) TaxID=1280523 RepID=A0A084B7U2_STACB|nr:hypothetical protein S7711_11420 [Stachybotrys chartarum IBT 7711]